MYPLMTNVTAQFVDDNGKPVAGGKVWTYASGTTSPKATYADPDGTAVNTNPIILDESGRANIYLEDGAYRVRVLSAKNALIADVNKISRYVTSTELDEFIQQVQDGLDELAQVKESLGTIVEQEIESQKGVAGGLTPLDENDKVDPLYLKKSDALDLDDTNTLATSKGLKLLADVSLEKGDLATGEAPIFAVRAWANFTGNDATIRAQGNIKSITRSGVGTYNVVFAINMEDANYSVTTAQAGRGDATSLAASNLTPSGFLLRANYGGDNTQGGYDPTDCFFQVVR